MTAAELRRRLVALWAELANTYRAIVHTRDLSLWDVPRLRFEVWYAEWRLQVLAEGVKAGWLPSDVEHVSELPEGWAA